MAKEARDKDGKRTKRPSLRYFFLHDELHVTLRIIRGKDLIIAWNYPQGSKKTYNYTDVLRRHEKAFTMAEVCKIVNRSKDTLQIAIRHGMIEMPAYTYTLDEHRNKSKYMFREKDILDVLDYLSSIHMGRPRKDGQITSASNLPTPREVRAMINDEQILYVKEGDTFVPTWRAKGI